MHEQEPIDALRAMAIDRVLFESGPDEPVLRLYRMTPAITLGFRQKVHQELRVETLEQENLQVVRRISGGRALLHDNGLTWTVCLPRESLQVPVRDSYRELCGPVLAGIQSLCPKVTLGQSNGAMGDFRACILEAGEAEAFVFQGRKVAGAAQRRGRQRILQHGEIQTGVAQFCKPWTYFRGMEVPLSEALWYARTCRLELSREDEQQLQCSILENWRRCFSELKQFEWTDSFSEAVNEACKDLRILHQRSENGQARRVAGTGSIDREASGGGI